MSRKLVSVIIDNIKQLNLYETYDDDTAEKRESQILSTRIFLVLFIISLTTLVGYASLSLQSTSVLVRNPTQQTYEQLYSLHPETLICPCTQTSIQIDKFLEVSVEYHQICSSKFVDIDWISTFSPMIPQLYYTLDIRRMISSELQILAAYCQSAITTISDAMTMLASSSLFVPLMLSRNDLKSQANVVIDQARANTIAEQKTTRMGIQSYYQQNQIISALGNNYLYIYQSDELQVFSFIKFINNWIYPPVINYTNYLDSELCSCADSSGCSYPSGIYPNLSGSNAIGHEGAIFPPVLSLVQIPDIHVACMAYDALTHSTLECFYDLNCLKLIFNQTDDIQPLTTNKSSNYPIASTLDTYIERSFIENITSHENFESLYRECQPTKCTYTYNSRGNVAFIITTILSLIGGLFTSLKVAAPFLLEFYVIIRTKLRKIFAKKQTISAVVIPDLDKQTVKKGFSPRELLKKIHEFVDNFNLFKLPYNDEHGRRNEILSTRLYILFMLLSVIMIVFYGLIIEHTLTFHVGSLSIDKYRDLYSHYPTLSCECENITNEYSVFITFNPRRHQICSSAFVSDIIIPRYTSDKNELPIGKFDLLVAESSYYSTGRSTCEMGGETLALVIDNFQETVYVSSYLTSEKEFYSRMNATVNNFIKLSPTKYTHLLDLVQLITQGNQFLTGTFTNAILQYNRSASNEEDMIEILWKYPNNESCVCSLSPTACSMTYDDYCNHTYHGNISVETCLSPLPGLTLACYIIESLLESTQECFYDIDCVMPTFSIRILLKRYNVSEVILSFISVVLDKNIPSRYALNATTNEIIRTFAVEDWNPNITYDSYYTNCNPINCYYTITKKFHIATIVTTVIGLVGGVSVVLKILVPFLINFIRSKRREAQEENMSKRFYIRVLLKKIRELNWFVTRETYQSAEIRRDQIISTRLYVLLLILSVVILSVYFGFATKSTLIVVENPTINDYKQLHSEDLSEFLCPCSKTTLSFEVFTSFDFTFHQICSSDFISSIWRTNLYKFGDKQEVSRGILSAHFQLIYLLCTSSNATFTVERNNLYATQYISVNAVPENQFQTQTQAAIDEFQIKIINSFRHDLEILIKTILGNQLMTIYETNWFLIPDPEGSNAIYTKARTYQSGNCSCASPKSIDCADPLVVGEQNTSVIGMKIGCLPVTSLLLSTLECFYNQTCIDEVKGSFQLQNLSITALNSSYSSQYSMNTTLDYIINNLFIEQSSGNVNYSAYYEQCSPQQCTYSMVTSNSALSIFATLLGLYGGLTVALRSIVPILIKIFRKIKNRCSSIRTVSPQQPF